MAGNNILFRIFVLIAWFSFAQPVFAFTVQDTVPRRHHVNKWQNLPIDDIYYQPGKIYPEAILPAPDTVGQAERRAALNRKKVHALRDTLFRPNHFGVEVTNTWYPAPQFVELSGNLGWKLKPTTFVQGGLSYAHYWINGFGLKVAARWGIDPVMIPISPPLSALWGLFYPRASNIVFYFNYCQFPICAVARVHFKKNYNIEFATGISFDVMLVQAWGGEYYGDVGALFETNSNLNAPAAHLLLGVPLEITASKVFKGMHEFDFGLTGSMAVHSYGSAQFSTSGYTAYYGAGAGAFIFRNTYAGIKVGYTFLGKALFKKHTKQS